MSGLSDSDDSVPPAMSNAKKRKQAGSGKSKKRKKMPMESMIDDAAILSGSESESDDELENEENNNDYVRDDFVVDEADEVEEKKKAADGLEDSDDDDDDSDDEGGNMRKVRRMRDTDRLDEDDLDLINEAKGITTKSTDEQERERRERMRIKARSENELKKGLFDEIDEEDGPRDGGKAAKKKGKRGGPGGRRAVDAFDEDGMDDFIEYDDEEARDTGRYRDDDDDDMMGNREGISEAQLNEANDIFGTEFLDFMQGGGNEDDADDDFEDKDRSYRERGVGVDLGVDSEEDESSDDEDLFASDEETSGLTSDQRAEALRLKKEKRQLKKAERRKAAAKKKADRRKAKLRRAFEPVQLIENFCTERDDEIRSKDVPERFFDKHTPFHGPDNITDITSDFSMMEEDEASWIITEVPAIAAEYAEIESVYDMNMKIDGDGMDVIEKKQKDILTSIMLALRYMHTDKLEPEFVRKYREDYITSPAVRANLYELMDKDTEWERILNAKKKVEGILGDLVKIAENDDALGADEDQVSKLKEDLRVAQGRLDESVRSEERIKNEIGQLENDEDDDDDLFGDDNADKEKVRE